MSIYSFAGVVTGMLVAISIILLTMRLRGKKGEVQEDERTQAIKGRAATSAIWATEAFLFVGWVADNLFTYYQGGVIRFFTPWSVMFLVLLATYTGAYSYFYQKNSADETDEASIARKRRIALTNLFVAICLLLALNGSPANQDPGVRYMLLAMSALMLGLSGYTLLRFRRQAGRRRPLSSRTGAPPMGTPVLSQVSAVCLAAATWY